jgi:hypothetical protein
MWPLWLIVHACCLQRQEFENMSLWQGDFGLKKEPMELPLTQQREESFFQSLHLGVAWILPVLGGLVVVVKLGKWRPKPGTSERRGRIDKHTVRVVT